MKINNKVDCYFHQTIKIEDFLRENVNFEKGIKFKIYRFLCRHRDEKIFVLFL